MHVQGMEYWLLILPKAKSFYCILLCLAGVKNDHSFVAVCCGVGGSRNISSVQSDTPTAPQNICAKQSSAYNWFIISPGERYVSVAFHGKQIADVFFSNSLVAWDSVA